MHLSATCSWRCSALDEPSCQLLGVSAGEGVVVMVYGCLAPTSLPVILALVPVASAGRLARIVASCPPQLVTCQLLGIVHRVKREHGASLLSIIKWCKSVEHHQIRTCDTAAFGSSQLALLGACMCLWAYGVLLHMLHAAQQAVFSSVWIHSVWIHRGVRSLQATLVMRLLMRVLK